MLLGPGAAALKRRKHAFIDKATLLRSQLSLPSLPCRASKTAAAVNTAPPQSTLRSRILFHPSHPNPCIRYLAASVTFPAYLILTPRAAFVCAQSICFPHLSHNGCTGSSLLTTAAAALPPLPQLHRRTAAAAAPLHRRRRHTSTRKFLPLQWLPLPW